MQEHIERLVRQKHPFAKNFKRHFLFQEDNVVDGFNEHLQAVDPVSGVHYWQFGPEVQLAEEKQRQTARELRNAAAAEKTKGKSAADSGLVSDVLAANPSSISGSAEFVLPAAKARKPKTNQKNHSEQASLTRHPFDISEEEEEQN